MIAHDQNLIDKYLTESKTARLALASNKKKDILISSRKIYEVTGVNEQEIDVYLKESKRVKYIFLNAGMKIYKIL
jgi:hypothetical protein